MPPFRFRDDIATADVAFEAWGEDREALFRACAEALLATMVGRPEAISPMVEVSVDLSDSDLELLLFAFLSELIFYKDARRLVLQAARLTLHDAPGHVRLTATLAGEPLDVTRHRPLVDVKAVTLHRFAVRRDRDRWHATVVLDI